MSRPLRELIFSLGFLTVAAVLYTLAYIVVNHELPW